MEGHDGFLAYVSIYLDFFWNFMRAACCDCVLQVLQKVQKDL